MARSRKIIEGITMTAAEEFQNLRNLVAMLNDLTGPEHDWDRKRYGQREAIKVRRLVTAWSDLLENATGSNIDVRKMKLHREDRLDLERFTKGIRVGIQANGTLCLLEYYSHAYDEAALQFMRLLRNSQRFRLAGPCPGVTRDKECGKWFVKKTKRRAIFCSRRCAANAAKAHERARNREKKLNRARLALREYPTRAECWRNLDWKEYAVRAKYRVSKRFLTEAVNRGWLVPPSNPHQRVRN